MLEALTDSEGAAGRGYGKAYATSAYVSISQHTSAYVRGYGKAYATYPFPLPYTYTIRDAPERTLYVCMYLSIDGWMDRWMDG